MKKHIRARRCLSHFVLIGLPLCAGVYDDLGAARDFAGAENGVFHQINRALVETHDADAKTACALDGCAQTCAVATEAAAGGR